MSTPPVSDADAAADAYFREAIARFGSRFTPAFNAWCDALISAGKRTEIAAVLTRVTHDQPDDASAWFKLGQVHMLSGEISAARAALARSAALLPGYSPTHQNLGLVEQWSGRLGDAENQFRTALACDPANADARFGLATTLLKLRRSGEGWALYAAGRAGASDNPPPVIRMRAWDGTSIARGALVVVADQGLGDVMQFARFVPPARARVPRLVVYCDDYVRTLVPLLSGVPGVDAIVGRDSGRQEVASVCTMSALPHLLGLGDKAFDPVPPYLAPPRDAAERWQRRLSALPGRKVGLCWSGSPRLGNANANMLDTRRSIRPDRLGTLAKIAGIAFVSLQKGAAGTASAGFPLIDWTDELHDYGETAGLVANLDLVVSVDTSIVHCAGAIGTPVWMLDRFDNCWRWGTDAANPGWYPNLRVFRQRSLGDWAPVIDELCAALVTWRESRGGA